jgi:hypothetical protein
MQWEDFRYLGEIGPILGMMTPRRANNNNHDDAELAAGWGDKWASVRGQQATLVLLFTVGVGLLWYSDMRQQERVIELAERIEGKAVARYDLVLANQAKMMAALASQTDEATKFRQEWIFIQSLDEKQKRELHLEIPPSLQPRVRR